VLGLLELLRGIERHRLLDRLIRGRAWIALVAFALLGIVTLQLALLKLNTSIGRSLESAALLQRENAALGIENSELAAGGRVETTAAHLGMSLIPAGALKFLTARPREDAARAAGALSAPVHTLTGSEEAAAAAAQAESPSTSGGEEQTASAAASTSASEAAGAATTPAGASEAGTATTSAATGEAGTAAREAGAAGAGSGGAERASSPVTGASGAPSPSAGEAGAGGGTQAGPTG
jgi:ParB-like chromosome segregation protein Spo0J